MSPNYYDRDRTIPVDEALRRSGGEPRSPKQRLMQEFDAHQREAKEAATWTRLTRTGLVIKRKLKGSP